MPAPFPPVDREALAHACRRHHVRRLCLFGSALREDFGVDSDVDLLVEYVPDHSPGWDVIDFEAELSRLFGGRRVDLVNRRFLDRRLRDRILASAVVQYEAEDDQG